MAEIGSDRHKNRTIRRRFGKGSVQLYKTNVLKTSLESYRYVPFYANLAQFLPKSYIPAIRQYRHGDGSHPVTNQAGID